MSRGLFLGAHGLYGISGFARLSFAPADANALAVFP